MKYEQIWSAVDKLARINGLSPSGLAKKAGLDATTFNKSKRIRPDGKQRWPSLDSINKILEVCNIGFEDFYNLAETGKEPERSNTIPVIEFSSVSESGMPLNPEKWNKIRFPDCTADIYALELDTDAYAPAYKQDTLLVLAENSEIRRSDKICLYKKDGSANLYEFIRRSPSTLELCDLNSKENISVRLSDVAQINRILWASQ